VYPLQLTYATEQQHFLIEQTTTLHHNGGQQAAKRSRSAEEGRDLRVAIWPGLSVRIRAQGSHPEDHHVHDTGQGRFLALP
jgi:hypothetical protein